MMSFSTLATSLPRSKKVLSRQLGCLDPHVLTHGGKRANSNVMEKLIGLIYKLVQRRKLRGDIGIVKHDESERIRRRLETLEADYGVAVIY